MQLSLFLLPWWHHYLCVLIIVIIIRVQEALISGVAVGRNTFLSSCSLANVPCTLMPVFRDFYHAAVCSWSCNGHCWVTMLVCDSTERRVISSSILFSFRNSFYITFPPSVLPSSSSSSFFLVVSNGL